MAKAERRASPRTNKAATIPARVQANDAAARPALEPAVLERSVGDRWGARTLLGELVVAEPAEGVSTALLEECMRTRRTVLLAATRGGHALVLGALQTEPSARVDAEGRLALSARAVEISGDERVTLKVGGAVVTLEKGGAVRLTGDRLTIDMGTSVHVLSADVSLP